MSDMCLRGKRISRNNAIQTAPMGDELGMMHVETGKYYLLDSVGHAIWNMAELPLSFETVVENLMEIYDVTQDDCARDVRVFVLDMVQKQILIVA